MLRVEAWLAAQHRHGDGWADSIGRSRGVFASPGDRLWLDVTAPAGVEVSVWSRTAEHAWTRHWRGIGTGAPSSVWPDGEVLEVQPARLLVLVGSAPTELLADHEALSCADIPVPIGDAPFVDACSLLEGAYRYAPKRIRSPTHTAPHGSARPGNLPHHGSHRRAGAEQRTVGGHELNGVLARHRHAHTVAVDFDIRPR